jgi:hypothetical protein
MLPQEHQSCLYKKYKKSSIKKYYFVACFLGTKGLKGFSVQGKVGAMAMLKKTKRVTQEHNMWALENSVIHTAQSICG